MLDLSIGIGVVLFLVGLLVAYRWYYPPEKDKELSYDFYQPKEGEKLRVFKVDMVSFNTMGFRGFMVKSFNIPNESAVYLGTKDQETYFQARGRFPMPKSYKVVKIEIEKGTLTIKLVRSYMEFALAMFAGAVFSLLFSTAISMFLYFILVAAQNLFFS